MAHVARIEKGARAPGWSPLFCVLPLALALALALSFLLHPHPTPLSIHPLSQAPAPPPSAYSPSPTDPLGNPLPGASPSPPPPTAVSEAARTRLFRAADACRKVGWASFWTQLALSLVSAGILLFSVAFTAGNGPGGALYLTLFGVVASFLSTFWAYGYTRMARKLRATAAAAARGSGGPVLVRKDDVLASLERGTALNIAGLASTLLGLQATVGLLVAKTLTNATANPFLAGGSGSYSPVLALDVFLVQASTNTAAAHFVSLLAGLWLTRLINRPAPYVAGKPA